MQLMKKICLITCLFYILPAWCQEIPQNSLSTSLVRLERNSQGLYNDFHLKFMTGIEYQRSVGRWNVGVKYEHGFNRIDYNNIPCADCLYGSGYIREDNVYLTTNYAAVQLLRNRLRLYTGMGLYYSNLNFSGDFQGGIAGGISRINTRYNTVGIAPSISVVFYPIDKLFIAFNSSMRLGLGNKSTFTSDQMQNAQEVVLTIPELKIGVNF